MSGQYPRSRLPGPGVQLFEMEIADGTLDREDTVRMTYGTATLNLSRNEQQALLDKSRHEERS